MRNVLTHTYRLAMSSMLVLSIVLIQIPTVSLAIGSAKTSPDTNRFRSQSESAALVPPIVFSNPAPITIADRAGVSTPNGIASPYPSSISVSGLTGALSNLTVTLTGYNALRPRDNEFALVGPSGQTLMLMSDTGDLISTAPGVNLTFSDGAPTPVPTGPGSSIPSGTYRPTDFPIAAPVGNDGFPAPGPTTVNSSAPAGTATLASVFNGSDANGTWSLYAIDDALGGGPSTVTGGWSLEITVDENIALTSTTVVSNLNPALTTQNITFTATVLSGGNPVTEGSVSFTDNGSPIATCNAVAVDGSGNAGCTTTLAEGSHAIVANFGGSPSFGTSSGSVIQIVNSATVVTGAQFCNIGGISIPDLPAPTNPYPSNIAVSGLAGSVSTLTVQLNGLTAPRTNHLDFLLVGPSGQAFQIVSDTGDAVTAATGINLTLDDAAPGQLPIGLPLTSGTFRPTDSTVIGAPDLYPPPAPGSYSQPAPAGVATFASVYGGTDPNGTWSLYAIDDAVGGGVSTVTGWCANFSVTPFTTTTSVVSSLNPSNVGDNVTFTATVTSAGGTPSGSVEFFDGATSLGTAALNASGQAALATSALTAGSHNITAAYQGATVGAGGGGFSGSVSPVLVQVVQIVQTAPTANSDNYSTNEDTPLNVAAPGVLANDSDPDPGTTLTAVLVSGPANALSFALNADGSFSYTPALNFNGSDSFTYKARDNTNLESSPVTVTITVNPVADGPEVIVRPGGSCGSGNGGTINLTVSDLDTPAGNLTLSASSSNTALVPNGNVTFGGSGADRTMTVAYNSHSGVQSSTITVTVSDGGGGTGTVIVTVIAGSNAADTINGTSGADMIFAGNANDTVNAGGGNDLVCGGNGDDTIDGGSGHDTINAENGNDTVNGGDGNDTLIGENGNDILRGQGGNDVIIGNNGNDQLIGGDDDDTLTGNNGADFFSGGSGVDTATDFTPAQGDTTDGTLGMFRNFLDLTNMRAGA